MADEKTQADAIRVYNTGATADGNAQANPDVSIGNFRASDEVQPITASIANAIANVTLLYVAGKNGAGVGTINAPTADTLTYTAPSGTVGPAVTIANGETKILQDGSDLTKYVRVTRTSATALTGTATLTLSLNVANACGFDAVSSAERVAGDIEFRCVGIKNVSTGNVTNINVVSKLLGTPQLSDVAQLPGTAIAGTIETSGSFADWPAKGFCFRQTGPLNDPAANELVYYKSRTDTVLTVEATGRSLGGSVFEDGTLTGSATDVMIPTTGVALAVEAPLSQPTGRFSIIADESTDPTFIFDVFRGDVVANQLAIGTLAAGEIHGVWMARITPPGQEPEINVTNGFSLLFDSP